MNVNYNPFRDVKNLVYIAQQSKNLNIKKPELTNKVNNVMRDLNLDPEALSGSQRRSFQAQWLKQVKKLSKENPDAELKDHAMSALLFTKARFLGVKDLNAEVDHVVAKMGFERPLNPGEKTAFAVSLLQSYQSALAKLGPKASKEDLANTALHEMELKYVGLELSTYVDEAIEEAGFDRELTPKERKNFSDIWMKELQEVSNKEPNAKLETRVQTANIMAKTKFAITLLRDDPVDAKEDKDLPRMRKEALAFLKSEPQRSDPKNARILKFLSHPDVKKFQALANRVDAKMQTIKTTQELATFISIELKKEINELVLKDNPNAGGDDIGDANLVVALLIKDKRLPAALDKLEEQTKQSMSTDFIGRDGLYQRLGVRSVQEEMIKGKLEKVTEAVSIGSGIDAKFPLEKQFMEDKRIQEIAEKHLVLFHESPNDDQKLEILSEWYQQAGAVYREIALEMGKESDITSGPQDLMPMFVASLLHLKDPAFHLAMEKLSGLAQSPELNKRENEVKLVALRTFTEASGDAVEVILIKGKLEKSAEAVVSTGSGVDAQFALEKRFMGDNRIQKAAEKHLALFKEAPDNDKKLEVLSEWYQQSGVVYKEIALEMRKERDIAKGVAAREDPIKDADIGAQDLMPMFVASLLHLKDPAFHLAMQKLSGLDQSPALNSKVKAKTELQAKLDMVKDAKLVALTTFAAASDYALEVI